MLGQPGVGDGLAGSPGLGQEEQTCGCGSAGLCLGSRWNHPRETWVPMDWVLLSQGPAPLSVPRVVAAPGPCVLHHAGGQRIVGSSGSHLCF